MRGPLTGGPKNPYVMCQATPHKCDAPVGAKQNHYNNCDRGGCFQNTKDLEGTKGAPGKGGFERRSTRGFEHVTNRPEFPLHKDLANSYGPGAGFTIDTTKPFDTILYYTNTIQYYNILDYTILYSTLLYSTLLYYTILYYTLLYFTLLYYTTINYNII